jgi:sulfatase modifying factor 1
MFRTSSKTNPRQSQNPENARMITHCAVNSTTLLACMLATTYCILATESKSDGPNNSLPRAPDAMLGSNAGQQRDDNGLKLRLVWCPQGRFIMGSPKSEKERNADEDQVDVALTKGFWLGKYEVTQLEWKQLMSTEPWVGQKLTKEGDDSPATFIDWENAIEFCRKLTKEERKAGRLPDGSEYTLPTEAQWEFACRARTKTQFSFGEDESKLPVYAWFIDNTVRIGEQYAHRVGQKGPNPWGLYDMHGNVWEWCRDLYAEKMPGGRDPEVAQGGSFRVYRGGCFGNAFGDCRSADRDGFVSSTRLSHLGFRVTLSTLP